MSSESIPGFKAEGKVAYISKPFPLIGHIGFGVIDRGYNLLQTRISSLCNLNCIFCSVGAGLSSKRILEFMLTDVNWLCNYIKEAVRFKGPIHVLFDAAGDPITNPRVIEFINEVKKLGKILSVTLETRLYGVDEKFINKLDEAGLDRINLSIDTLDEDKAKRLVGVRSYSVFKIMKLAEYITSSTNIDLHITPLWIPGVNDEDIKNIIKWALKINAGKKVPPLGIQKYVEHKHGRRIPGVREWSWSYFFKKLRELEEEFGIKLILSPEDYGMRKTRQIKSPFKKGEIVKLQIVHYGWLRNEYVAVTLDYRWVFTIVSKKLFFTPGEIIKAVVIRDKDNILIARPL